MKAVKQILMGAVIAAAGAVSAVTTYTVSNTNSSASVANSLPWALNQVKNNTTQTSPSGGVFRVTFAPSVYGCQLPASTSTVYLYSSYAKVVIDGTGSGVTIVDSGNASSSKEIFNLQRSSSSLIVSNLTFSTSGRTLVTHMGTKVEVVGCRFENCRSAKSLINASLNARETKIERTTFIDNVISGTGDTSAGSCVHVEKGRLFLNHCSFINNRSSKAGGAVYSDTTNIAAVANCSFVGNTSGIGAGEAIYFDSKTQQGYLIESLFFNNHEADVFTCSCSNKVGVKVVDCGYEGIATDAGDFSYVGDPVADVTCEAVCGTATPRLVSRVVNGVRQTAPFPAPLYSGRKGAYTFQHSDDWTNAGLVDYTLTPSERERRRYRLWGGGETASFGRMDPIDIFGTAKPTSASGINPTVGAVQYYQETPSLTVTTLEDLDCPVDGEISFREAVQYASQYADLVTDGKARIAFVPALAAQAVDDNLRIPVTEGDIALGSQLTADTLVVAPPEGLRLVFCGKTNGTARVAAGRLFKLDAGAKLELHDLDVENFQPVYGSGGALYLTGNNSVVVSNVCFRRNGVTRFEAGGAIYAGAGSTLKAYGSAFEDNDGGCCGGAVYLEESTETAYALFERTTFYYNSTMSALDDEGGAVYAGSGRVVFANTSLIRNRGHVAALQVRPGATVTMVNTFVTDSVAQANTSDSTGTAINVADAATATFRLANSVVGGYRFSAPDRRKGFCQLRTGDDATVLFVNSIVSANNAIAETGGGRFVTYTEDELADCVFGTRATKIVHGVSQRFLFPKEGGPLFGAGMEIHHTADWKTIRAYYGGRNNAARTVINVCTGARPPEGFLFQVLTADILDNDWSREVGGTILRRSRRPIGPLWGATAAQAQRNPNFDANMTDNGWQITVPGDYTLAYLPQICGGNYVTSVKFAADVTAFDPLCAQTAQTVREYVVEEGNSSFKTVGGALYSADGCTFLALPPDYCNYSVFVAPGVETVASNAFSTLSENVQYEMGGIQVSLPASVTTLEEGAFAGIDNVDVHMYGMAAPACTDAVFTESCNIHVFVPFGSTGWDGNPNSTALPESWHGEGVGLEHWSPTEWPSLQVTTLQDVEDGTDGLISLREAIKYAGLSVSFYTNDRAEITFAPDLPVDGETGKMEIELALGEIDLIDEGVRGGRTLAISVLDGQMLALVGSSAAQAHRRCLYVGENVHLELRNTEIRQFDCSGEDADSHIAGAVYLGWGSTFVASNCYFRGNGPASNVPNSSSTEGGAVYIRSFSDARFYDCSFYSNEAAIGSAVAIEHGEAAEAPFVLFERTSFARNRAYHPSLDDNFGGAVSVGCSARVVFNTCSLVANEGFISDITVHSAAEVTMVNSAVSDSVAQRGTGHETGAAIVISEDEETEFRAVNCVFGGYQDAAALAKNYRQICGWNGELCESDPTSDALFQFVNSIVARAPDSGAIDTGVWGAYTQEDFTNYVYDVTAANTSAATYQMFRPSQSDVPKFFRPLGRDSVLCGTGVTIYHDADWESIAWRYGEEDPVEVIGNGAAATIPVTRDLLGNDWVGTLGLSERQRNIGPLGAWDLAGDFETAARAIPDYRRTLIGDIDLSEECRIVLPAERKFLPPLCGGLFVSEVEVGPAVTTVDPGCVVSAPEVRSYVAVDHAIYSSMGGCLYTNTPNGKVLVAVPPARMSVLVQNGTRGVGADAFRYVRELEDVCLPSSLWFIEDGAFAGCNFDIYFNTMSAPTYAPTAFQGCDAAHTVFVPEGSKGWNGDPNSFVLPAKWPAADGVDGMPIESYTPDDYPSLVVTTCEDVEDGCDGVVSLREAIANLSSSWLYDNNRAVITFDPALADANGVINLSFDEGLGAMTLSPELESSSIVLTAPADCRVRICGCPEGGCCAGESGLFALETIGGSITFSGLDIEGFSSDHAAAIWSDWEATYIGEFVITNCTFRNCWSESGDGGAVCVGAIKATVADSVFEGNCQCDPDGAGGGLALRACGWNDIAGEARIERCSFYGNFARTGGGLAVFGCENKDRISVVNTSIIDNECSGTGAGVWVGGRGTATFTHMSVFDNVSNNEDDYDDFVIEAVAHESGTKLEFVNSALSAPYGSANAKYIDYDVCFVGTDVRASNTAFGHSRKGSAPADCVVGCSFSAPVTEWFNPVSLVANAFTRLPMPARTPIAGGGATTLGLAATDVALDQLGLARTAAYNAVGAIAADPADRPLSGYAAWVAEKGLAGAEAAWNAKPARWGGDWANAFIYTFGEGLVDGTSVFLDISFDAAGNPVITTTPVVEGHDDFTLHVIGAPTLNDWSAPVFLNRNGNEWTLPAGQSARFFRVRLETDPNRPLSQLTKQGEK